MSAERVMQWYEGPVEGRPSLRQALWISLAAHLALVASLSLAPTAPPLDLPPAITVDLLAALPTPAAAKPAPKPLPAAPPKPKVKLLPKEAPAATKKPRVKPKPEPVIRRERPKEMSYDDALAQLRQETGEPPPVTHTPQTVARSQTGASTRGVKVSPEVAAWMLATKRHIRSTWITPPEFRESGLAAELIVNVASDGRVLGEPRLVRSSGNPFYDDNAKRAILKASPLPAPPKAGKRTIIFTPEE